MRRLIARLAGRGEDGGGRGSGQGADRGARGGATTASAHGSAARGRRTAAGSAAGGAAGRRFIDPAVLARIGNLELVARTVVDGFLSGLHRSRFLGSSVDFAEHRAYMPGDDIRRIDWRLYARTDRYHVKEFEAETNANFVAAVDVSASMRYASGAVSKLDYARMLAASLAYFSSRQRDRIGVGTFGQELLDWVPPAADRLDAVLHAVDRAGGDARTGASGGVGMRQALHAIAGRLDRRGVVAVISDLYAEPDTIVDAVRPLGFAGGDVVVFQVLDPAELEFPFEDAANFRDLETGVRIPVVASELRDRYRKRMDAHIAEISRRLRGDRIDHVLLDTSKPLDHALFAYLTGRDRRRRVR